MNGETGATRDPREQAGRSAPGPDSSSPDSTRARVPGLRRPEHYIDLTVDTQFTAAWVALSILLSLLGVALQSPVLLTVAAMLLVIAGLAWLWNRFSLSGLQYARRFSESRAFLGETIELELEVRNQKLLPLTWLEVQDSFPAGLPVNGTRLVASPTSNMAEYRSFWSLGAFQRVSRRFTVECTQRGYHGYGPASLASGDGFGFFSRQQRRTARDRLIVYPRLYTVAELRLPAKNPFGPRTAKDRLFEDPLRTAGIRQWQPGDGLRRIHWPATARYQQLQSRLYEPSEEPQILLFLNVATMPRHWQGNIPELLERAISVAGSLAALCVQLRLPVGLVANGFLPGSDQPLRLLPGRSPDQLVRILELLAAVIPFATRPIEEMLLREAPRLPWGATLVVVTAVAHEALLVSLLALAQAGRQIVLFTLAEEPPAMQIPGILVYHLPHLVSDLIVPQEVP